MEICARVSKDGLTVKPEPILEPFWTDLGETAARAASQEANGGFSSSESRLFTSTMRVIGPFLSLSLSAFLLYIHLLYANKVF